jgi:hypothetical protein
MMIYKKSTPRVGNKPLIVLAICTRDLAVFEAICAQGLARLLYPRGFRYKLLIVENRRESTGDLQPIGIDIPVHYVLERKLGLSAARNRVFTEAVKLNADWLALLDDDVVPMENWLSEYVQALESRPEAKLFYGQYWYRFLNGYSLAIERGADSFEAVIEEPVLFGAGNLLLHKSLYCVHGVRFDPRFDGCGSEDVDLRHQVVACGVEPVPVPRAVIQETITTRRATLASGFHRKLNAGVSGIIMLKKYSSPLAFTVGVSVQMPRRFVNLLGDWWRAGKAYMIRAEDRGELLDVALASLALLIGLIMALCGYRGSYYSRKEE